MEQPPITPPAPPTDPDPQHLPTTHRHLRRGWTTGACATAATQAAYTALLTGSFPDTVTVALPRGQRPVFVSASERLSDRPDHWAESGVIKDAGDDPDVTHGALVLARVWRSAASGVHFIAGEGVGTVTRAGLPLAVGEPAINPVPRQMMRTAVKALAEAHSVACDLVIQISIRDGERLAQQTWNPRLGIIGGLSVLGTTGIVIPFSCSAWIHAIHRGIDVARAAGLRHVAGCTGSQSEQAVQEFHRLPDIAMLDMGDFVGGMLKYLRRHPVPKVTIGGGFAKLVKLASGSMDLHSSRSQVDLDWLASEARSIGASDTLSQRIQHANTAAEVVSLVGELPLVTHIAGLARTQTVRILNCDSEVDVVVVGRDGAVIGYV